MKPPKKKATENLAKVAKQTQEEIKKKMEINWEKFNFESERAIDNTEKKIKSFHEKIAIADQKDWERLEGLETLAKKKQDA